MMRTLAVIQARMSSSRFPGKVLHPLAGRPMLRHVYDRVAQAAAVHQVLVATSRDPSDDPIAQYCSSQGIGCVRGPLDDVLERFRLAVAGTGADAVIRITADCPLVDPRLIDQTVAPVIAGHADFATNEGGRPFPRGLDVEAASAAALLRAAAEASEPYDREHVMPYLYRVPGRFSVAVIQGPEPRAGEDLARWRWTVDEPADLALVEALLARVPDPAAPWQAYADAIRREPGLLALNASVGQKTTGAAPK